MRKSRIWFFLFAFLSSAWAFAAQAQPHAQAQPIAQPIAQPQAQFDRQAEVYSRAQAMALASNPAADAYVAHLLATSRSKAEGALAHRVDALIADNGLSWPARERALMQFAANVRSFPREAQTEGVLIELESYQQKVLVPHEEGRGQYNIPLFDIKAAARGTRNHWSYEESRTSVQQALASGQSGLAQSIAQLSGSQRQGALQAMRQARIDELQMHYQDVAKALTADPGVAPVAAIVAERLQDANLTRLVFASGDADSTVQLVQRIPGLFSQAKAYELLVMASSVAGAESAATVALGQLADSQAANRHLLAQLGNEATGASAALALSRNHDSMTREQLSQLALEPGLRGLHAALALKLDGSKQAHDLLAALKSNPAASKQVQKEVSKWVSE